jgi:hypothetical protein
MGILEFDDYLKYCFLGYVQALLGVRCSASVPLPDQTTEHSFYLVLSPQIHRCSMYGLFTYIWLIVGVLLVVEVKAFQ